MRWRNHGRTCCRPNGAAMSWAIRRSWGAKYQNELQRAQVRRIAGLGGSGGTLDYVAAWFIKAGQFVQDNRRIRIAFVSTNSICQGEQVAQLWPILFDRCGLEIAFAHRTFSWGSEARGKAHVHVIIVGLAHRDHEPAEKNGCSAIRTSRAIRWRAATRR
ncbi:DNA methyltransferase [Novosphingobium colocasiae]